MDAAQWKLGMFDPDQGWLPVSLDHVFDREIQKGLERIAVAPREAHVKYLTLLVSALGGPFRFVYYLLSESADYPSGYYSVVRDLSRIELEKLLEDFSAFFENDGRHTLWIASPNEKATLILDEHNLIYGYGPLDLWESKLSASDLRRGSVTIPFPHTHHRHDGLESELDRLMKREIWSMRPPFG